MTSTTLLKFVAAGLINPRLMQVVEFGSSARAELSKLFGQGYSWHGSFDGSPVVAIYCDKGKLPFSENWDFAGYGDKGVNCNIFCYAFK